MNKQMFFAPFAVALVLRFVKAIESGTDRFFDWFETSRGFVWMEERIDRASKFPPPPKK